MRFVYQCFKECFKEKQRMYMNSFLLGYQEKTIQQLEKDVARHDKWIVGCCFICVPCCLFMFVTNVYKMICG